MALEFPVIYLLPTHFNDDTAAQHELEAQITTLTYDPNEAEVFLGKISRKARALLELRSLKIATEEVLPAGTSEPQKKRRKIASVNEIDSSSESDDHASTQAGYDSKTDRHKSASTIKVVKLAWFTDSVAKGELLPLDEYLVYEGRKMEVPVSPATKSTKSVMKAPSKPEDILERARADPSNNTSHKYSYRSSRRNQDVQHKSPVVKPPSLVKQTTSEHDLDEHLPPIPDFLHTTYSCQRPTPINTPNEIFVDELTKIRTTRQLIGDKIGVRAYSTSIATIAAYPYHLQTAQEVGRLPGCGPKIAVLFQEFKETGQLREGSDAEADPKLSVLKLFYEIWGVADTTAREFYNKGWRDLDDVVEYGWNSLSRVQQIGVKYYDELQLKIPRTEVEAISNVILEHANKIRKGYQMVIVGGYRRGKQMSGDVDVIISHPDESATERFIEKIVLSLEKDKFITHTLMLSTRNSERGQSPVPWKGNERRGSGFDTLDKALLVWQDPHFAPTNDEPQNTNPHRRVDIIISPWKTVGCAVLGWTSGTTFQRDLRRYCKRVRSLKFDSSGIRSRTDGSWIDVEDGGQGKSPDMLTAERRVFAGLELEWRTPEERCTG